ncbi:uncharacterized protein LOC109859871 [Pseudomyrmex gracilis]|uniref:uncharacterized protein LOC109859871 n=1 Tax=Pseudomyrmex gracilis TaxID=219809 RepID=UPI0009956570|nr:uncharacterized protein LOC109859871 [Pseudomyrmex gracilis]
MDPVRSFSFFKEEPRKRTRSNTELEIKSDKKQKQPVQQTRNLLDLPNEILLYIMKYVDRKDLKNLRLCCYRLSRLALDKSFWTMDYRKKSYLLEFYPFVQYEHILEPLTVCLALCGTFYRRNRIVDTVKISFYRNPIEPLLFFTLQKCRMLKELSIEEYYFNTDEVTIQKFPLTLDKLELKRCVIFKRLIDTHMCYPLWDISSHFFDEICTFVPNIKCLILNSVLCHITPIFLRDISKLKHLNELRLTSCLRIHESPSEIKILDFICNFETLEILDLRNTAVDTRLVGEFCRLKSLKHLYLECPKYLRKECSNESLEDLKTLRSESEIWFRLFDEKLYTFQSKVELLLAENRVEEIISFRNDLFQNYFLSNISHYISRCNNLETVCIRHYSHITKTDITILASTVPNLKELDITGCSVTLEDVKNFKSQRPNVKISSSFVT